MAKKWKSRGNSNGNTNNNPRENPELTEDTSGEVQRDSSSSRTGRSSTSKNSKIRSNYWFAFETKNLSSVLISQKYFNSNAVITPFNSVNNTSVSIRLSLNPILSRLDKQAKVWAEKMYSNQNLYLKAIISDYRERWIDWLEKCFKYSYFKCVLCGLTDEIVAEIPSDVPVIAGHSILYYFLRQQSFTFKYNDISIRYYFDCTQDDYESILAQAKSYDFLKDSIIEGRRFFVENAELDRILRGLSDYSDDDSPRFMPFVDDEKTLQYTTMDNFSICNSFYKASSGTSELNWYYCYSDDVNILDPKTLFGKALFICAAKDESYFSYFDYNSQNDMNYLVKYEVASLCGSDFPEYRKK